MRCQDCDRRYLAHILAPSSILFAKCPRCYRMDLSSWDQKHYHAPARIRLKVALGARRMRCEACRCNFASFRVRRRWYRHPEVAENGREPGAETKEAASKR